MAIKWEWKLKDDVGANRWKKFDKAIADEAAMSCALAMHWLKAVATAPVPAATFEPGVLKTVKDLAGAVKSKGFPGADPAKAFNTLQNQVKFTTIGKPGKITPKGDELQAAIKALDKGTASLLHLYGSKGDTWHTLAIDREKGSKRIFDPFKGQWVAAESKEAAQEIVSTYTSSSFDGFAILTAEAQSAGHVDQSSTRTFEQRLKDFSPELGGFLGKVWEKRKTVDLDDIDGTWDIYALYSAGKDDRKYSFKELKTFLADLAKIAGKYDVEIQQLVDKDKKTRTIKSLSPADRKANGPFLWTAFYHAICKDEPKGTVARVYVHAASTKASLELMTTIIGEFGKNKGLWEAKTCGPGSNRLDTIVAYFYDEESAKSLVEVLKGVQAKKKELFIDKLPPLVKRDAPGIGTAGEPPAIEVDIHTRHIIDNDDPTGFKDPTRHSFGSFFSTLCWIALKETPKVDKDDADGRHMLDNVLQSLRLLEIDPVKAHRFPANAKLEQWYAAQKDKFGAD
jgi:hypothetical protein